MKELHFLAFKTRQMTAWVSLADDAILNLCARSLSRDMEKLKQ